MNERLRGIRYEEDEGNGEDGGLVVDTETGTRRAIQLISILRQSVCTEASIYSDGKDGFHTPMPTIWQDVKTSQKEGA